MVKTAVRRSYPISFCGCRGLRVGACSVEMRYIADADAFVREHLPMSAVTIERPTG